MGRLWSLLPGLLLGLQSGRRLLHPFQCPPCCSPAAGRLWRGPQVHGGGQAGQCQGRGRGQSQSRQNYPSKCEDGINSQINLELSASYVYLSMSYYFDRDDVALKNFAKFYLEQSLEEQEHAAKLMKFQNQRGGRIILKDIKKPHRDEWGNGLEAMEHALQLEKAVNQRLLDLHKLASEQNDPILCEFLESNYLNEQIEAIKKLGDHITNLKRLGAPENGMGEYLFDKHTLGESS
ncbi:ferritin heavy chain B-like isoform X1 [Cetorhinus maximus]